MLIEGNNVDIWDMKIINLRKKDFEKLKEQKI